MDDSPNTIPPVDLKAGRADPVTTLDELLVKLRAYRSINEWGDPVRHEILDQAADALEAAARENERLRVAHTTVEAELTANERMIDTLKDALADAVSTNTETARQRDACECEARRLRDALADVVNPLGNLRREAEANGCELSGMAYQIANDLGFVQSIARNALSGGPHE